MGEGEGGMVGGGAHARINPAVAINPKNIIVFAILFLMVISLVIKPPNTLCSVELAVFLTL